MRELRDNCRRRASLISLRHGCRALAGSTEHRQAKKNENWIMSGLLIDSDHPRGKTSTRTRHLHLVYDESQKSFKQTELNETTL